MRENETEKTEVAEVAPKPDGIEARIDAWHRKHFAGTATEIWNLSFAAKEDLKKLLSI